MNLHKIILTKIMVVILWLFSSTLLADWVNVAHRFPVFHQVVSEQLNTTDAETFFSYWSENDARLLESIFDQLESSKINHSHRINDLNIKQFSNPVFGVLGELYLSSYMRKHFANQSDVFIMNGWDISQCTQTMGIKGNISDGVVYRLYGDSIEIIYVLESKMGGATFSESQANGYFERWQTRGAYVYDHRGEIVHFKPKNIRFKTNSIEIDGVERIDVSNHLSDTFQGYQTIDSMSFTQFLSYTVNAGSEKHKSRLREFGEYLQTTMNTKQAKQISENYGRLYFDTKNKNSSGKKKIKNKPRKNNDKWMEPVEFSLALKKWFWDQKDAGKIVWPSPSKSIGGVNGGLLRKNIEHYGSSTQVFIHHTSTKTKILLASKGSLPVAYHLEFKLMNADTPSHGLKDAFLIYMNVLETNGGELAISKLSRIKANYDRVFHDSQDNCNLKFREGTKI